MTATKHAPKPRAPRTRRRRAKGALSWLLALASLVALLALAACQRATPRLAMPQPSVPPHQRSEGDYLPRIDDDAQWRAIASSPGRQLLARTEVVKVIIDLRNDWRVYFLQSRRWEIHYFFARRFLSFPGQPIEEHGEFNIAEYRRPDRRFVLATITRYLDRDEYSFELIAGDLLDVPRTVRAFETVRHLVHFGPALRYHPVPPHHERALDEFRMANVPLRTSQELYAGVQYQPVNPGEAIGYLRFIDGVPDPARVRRNDIVVLAQNPIELPVCAGIVTQELQAPLAHVALLAINRHTPDMALRGAFANSTLRELEGRLVRLRVGPQQWSVEPASREQAERAWESLRPRIPLDPPFSERRVELPALAQLRASDVDVVGAKAAQLAELAHVQPPIAVPRGFAVPFWAYRAHLASGGIDAALREGLARADAPSNSDARAALLRSVRERIAQAPVDPALLARVRARIDELFAGRRVRFRSSTNVEDLHGFNGAGLYRSVTLEPNPTSAQIADALRTVWASTWNLQAHEERSWFRVRESRVAMGVLVQESIDDDVDVVAITGNPFNYGRPAVFLNAQVARDDGAAVTAAHGDEVPEQVLYYTYADEREFERLSRSSRTQGAPVLTDSEIEQLSHALRAIHRHFLGVEVGMNPSAIDVELVLERATRRPYFVQARPLQLRYDQNRGYAEEPE